MWPGVAGLSCLTCPRLLGPISSGHPLSVIFSAGLPSPFLSPAPKCPQGFLHTKTHQQNQRFAETPAKVKPFHFEFMGSLHKDIPWPGGGLLKPKALASLIPDRNLRPFCSDLGSGNRNYIATNHGILGMFRNRQLFFQLRCWEHLSNGEFVDLPGVHPSAWTGWENAWSEWVLKFSVPSFHTRNIIFLRGICGSNHWHRYITHRPTAQLGTVSKNFKLRTCIRQSHKLSQTLCHRGL